MTHLHLKAAAALIACMILTGFLVSVLNMRHVVEKNIVPSTTVITPIPTVTLRDNFKKGTHTITGSIIVPNACVTPAVMATSTTQNILIAVSLANDTDICLETPTAASFKTTIIAPANLPIIVTINGVPATTTPL